MATNEESLTTMMLEMRKMLSQLRQEVDSLKQENLHLRMTGTQPMPALEEDWLDDAPSSEASLEKKSNSFSTSLGTPPKVFNREHVRTRVLSNSELDFCFNSLDAIDESSVSLISVMSTVDEDEMVVMAQIFKKPTPNKTTAQTRRLVLPPPPPIQSSGHSSRTPRAISRFHHLPDGLVILTRSGMVVRYQESNQSGETQIRHSPIVGEPFFEIAPYPEVRALKSAFKQFVRGELDSMAMFNVSYEDGGRRHELLLNMTRGKEEGQYAVMIKRR